MHIIKKNKERLCSLRRKNYRKNCDKMKAASCAYYRSNTEARKAAYSRKAKVVIKRARQYYTKFIFHTPHALHVGKEQFVIIIAMSPQSFMILYM